MENIHKYREKNCENDHNDSKICLKYVYLIFIVNNFFVYSPTNRYLFQVNYVL